MGVDFTGVTLPFSASDLLASGSGLLGLVATFVLLAMAFPLVSKLIGFIRRSFSTK